MIADSESGHFKDIDGVSHVLHGQNVVVKRHPYIPDIDGPFDSQMSLNEQKDIPDLVTWGVNHIRLGVIWEAVEIAPGVYNDTYLD